ncbi:MAG TPA: transglutaminase-like domain-containing protein [Trebonia sp.]
MTAATAGGQQAARTASRPAVALPGRDELIDALALGVLAVIGIVGFRDVYGGTGYLIAGVAGVVLGLLLSHAGQRARIPLLGIAAIGVLAFVVLGGLVTSGLVTGGPGSGGLSGAVPTPTVMHAILVASVAGWKELLTTAQPVGSTARLLVLPYLLGLASAMAGHALARRTRTVLLPAAPPAGVVALSILFGSGRASAAALQGAGFAAIALAWAAARQQRGASRLATVGRQRPWQRLGASVAVLAVAGGGALVLGPRLPGAGAHQRVVLQAVPPFNIDEYPSPLAGFRDYTKEASPSVGVYAKKLLSTSGFTPGTAVRIAAMDTYDDVVWGVANAQASRTTFAGFQRVGAVLPGSSDAGGTRSGTIIIDGGYQQPWLPDLAGTMAFGFTGTAGTAVQGQLRYNVATGTGVVPGGVPGGLTYSVTASQPGPQAQDLPGATPSGAPDPDITIPAAVTAFASAHIGGASTPIGKVLALASYLRANGQYSDGGDGEAQVVGGHSAGRLTTFLGSQLVGDDEQYAAAMALLANAVGVPARVVLDGYTEPDGSVYGRDVHADVELDLAQYGWVTLPYAAFVGNKKPQPQPRQKPQPQPAKAVPQPQQVNAPVTGNQESSANSRTIPPRQKRSGFHIPAVVLMLLTDIGIPLGILAVIAGALGGAKGLRRRRRRSGQPAARVAGAWRELVDLGRDLGIAARPGLTRREQAAAYAADSRHRLGGATAVAAAADAAIFGPGDPEPAAAAHVWELVGLARRDAVANLPRWRRAWIAVSPASLWASRAALPRPSAPRIPRRARPVPRPAPPEPALAGARSDPQ